jgi:hypothetical protein
VLELEEDEVEVAAPEIPVVLLVVLDETLL